MLFNSYEFILFFLPVVAGMFVALSRFGAPRICIAWLAAASLFFYGWWNPAYLLLLGTSLVVNFVMGRTLVTVRERSPALKYVLVAAGLIFNLGLLGYYKYGGFAVTITNDLFDSNFTWTHIALPLAISFFTFQQVAYLIDTAAGRVGKVSALDYLLFVTFFPQLIAGPIVHHQEMMPQFQRTTGRIDREDLQVGFAIFTLGLAKKILVADTIAQYVAPIYAAAGHSEVTFLQAWIAGLGFTLQVYFDFAGYSEMALGAARIFGIRLPVNFNSPLKATNIIDFWSRWHMTLTRFLTGYIFTPISLAAMRRVSARKAPKVQGLRKRFRGFGTTLAGPTLLTMLLAGVWHGAGYHFVIFGLLHGSYLVVNHAWRNFRHWAFKDSEGYERITAPIGVLLTLTCVSFATLFFGADSMTAARNLAVAFLGLDGISIPEGIYVHLQALHAILSALGVNVDTTPGSLMVAGITVCALGLLLAWFFPNTLDMLRDRDPAIGYKTTLGHSDNVNGFRLLNRASWKWAPTKGWGVGFGVLFALCLMSLQRVNVFLYWQF